MQSQKGASQQLTNLLMDFGKMCACLKGFSERKEAEIDCNEGKRKTPKCVLKTQ